MADRASSSLSVAGSNRPQTSSSRPGTAGRPASSGRPRSSASRAGTSAVRPASSASRPRTSAERPVSSQSRSAWGADPRSPVGLDNPAIALDDDDIAPAAMEEEVYEQGLNDSQKAAALKQLPEPENTSGCWYRFKAGIRAIWMTRDTEDTKKDPELHVKATLRELVIYSVFLTILCIITFGMTSPTMYYYTKVMSELFLDSTYPDTKNTFRGSTTMQDFWRFAETPLMDGLYWEKWYNDRNVSTDELGYIFYENKLLGVPRMRQLKVRSDSCSVTDEFQQEISKCYAAYSSAAEFTEYLNFSTNDYTPTAYNHKTAGDIGGSGHWGLLARYSGGGYLQNLNITKSQSLEIIQELKENLWLDRATRSVFVDFTVYNANINLFCVIRLLFEFPATGGAIPSWNFRTVKLIRYVSATDHFVLACEAMFVLFIIYYTIEELIEIKKHKLKYIKSFWNILDILVITISYICIIFNAYRTMAVSDKLETLLDNPYTYPDFEFLSYWQTQFNSAIAITVFMAWVKVFKYISFNKTMTQLSSTLARCASDLAGFAVMFFIVFLAFAQLGYLIFGTQVKDFSSFDNAIFTLFRIILGDFNFHELEAANRVLGPIYFILYVFFVFFVLLNMFLAIINDTYSEVKAEIADQKDEFAVGDYFKKGYNNMMSKLNIKRDKIVDIQKALQSADINQDKQLDFEEWRQDLKSRGYAEAEIEAVFAKYDIDGDRILDEAEQRRMQADLEGQKAELNKEYHDLEDKALHGMDDSDDDDDLMASRRSEGVWLAGDGSGPARRGVSQEEFNLLTRRVDRMEHSIGSIVSKIDAVLVKLEAMERAKSKRRETMNKILDSITEAEGVSEEDRRENMERLVREELEKWETDSMRGTSPAPGPSGHRPMSRVGSGMGGMGGMSDA